MYRIYTEPKHRDSIQKKLGIDLTQDDDSSLKAASDPSYDNLRLLLAAGLHESRQAVFMADQLFNADSDHACYNNDSFCIAYLFGLDDPRKHAATLRVIENGMAGYYEGVTHNGFYLSDLLINLRAMTPIGQPNLYCHLKEKRIRGIAKALAISNSELAECAEKVCRWSFATGYGLYIDSSLYDFQADSPLHISRLEMIADAYLPKGAFSTEFGMAKANLEMGDSRVNFKVRAPPKEVL
jgi:hypothetical protein